MTRFLFLLVLMTEFAGAKIYKGAELRTIHTYTYGRIEARFMPADGDGIVASLFTYHEINALSEWNEIDIEILGRYKDDVQLTTIVPNQLTFSSHYFTHFNPHTAYHTYAYEWTPDYVAWFIDGSEVYRQSGEHISTLKLPQKIMMNLWASDGVTWVGNWNDAVLPRFSYYDWVSYAAYTPGSGSMGSGNNFTPQWRDDFDRFDSARWQKATHTFNGNLVNFIPDNIVYKNGKMILCLTDETHTGLTDKTAPGILWARLEDDSVRIRFSEKIKPVSAENKANYGVGTFKILDAHLLPDSQTVILNTQRQDSVNASTVVAFNMADLASPSNVQSYILSDLILSAPLTLPVKINTGSENPSTGLLADQAWGTDTEYGHMDGYNQVVNDYNVYNPNMDIVYRTELNNVAKYKVRLSPGVYTISLNFAESRYQQPGLRQFDVVMEDSMVAVDLDLQQKAGFHQAYALTLSDFSVMDGILDIHFINWIDRPLINAITIYQTPTALDSRTGANFPGVIKLFHNYPNPFNPVTRIAYRLGMPAAVSLTIYDLSGRRIKKLVRTWQKAGRYVVTFDADGLASGLYIYRLKVGSGQKIFIQSHKMLLLH